MRNLHNIRPPIDDVLMDVIWTHIRDGYYYFERNPEGTIYRIKMKDDTIWQTCDPSLHERWGGSTWAKKGRPPITLPYEIVEN